MIDELKKSWDKFLKSGHINDYLNYKLYQRKKEELPNETNNFLSRNRLKDDRL